MNPEYKTTLAILDANIKCEYKTITHSDRPDLGAFLQDSPPHYSPTKGIFHNHDGYEILILLDGEMNFYCEGDGKKIIPGNVVLLPPYIFHHGILLNSHIYNRIVINIRESFMPTLCSEQTDLSSCFFQQPARQLNIINLSDNERNQLVNLSRKLQSTLSSTEYGSDILSKIYIQKILLLINLHNKPITESAHNYKGIMPNLVADTFTYIEKNIASEITLKNISDAIHLNSTYISRCFKNITGISLQQYIIEKKITLAQKYLREGYSPSDVCYMVGFNNYSNFSRTFSKHAGLSPKQYQQKNKAIFSYTQ